MTPSSAPSFADHHATSKDAVYGPVLFGLSQIFFAVVTVVSQKFWPPVPDELLFRSVALNVCAAVMALTGLGLIFARTQRLSAWILALQYVLFSLCFLPRVTGYPHLIGAWLGFAEHVAILAGALSICGQYLASEATARNWARGLHGLFGACAIIFGLSHVLSLPETVAIVPAWLPGSKAFWALATAIAHFAVAFALILNWQVRLASILGAGMYVAFGLLVWMPIILKSPSDWMPWGCVALSLMLAGALLSLGDGWSPRTHGQTRG